ncbi:multi-sensor hybrid histidine kinase [Caballeronia hypogeia]|uniref:Sensory/regulatory protein RpfC n=1 Tax=Caballeronia hypogeia TaxID=1777140 RepID=A0A157ZI04_9BURK|nr:response regulator [Caballeronia hypogeia]SAK45131.1 multi-sensor hybrid histidine kinase [Caballeronia hypogeia]
MLNRQSLTFRMTVFIVVVCVLLVSTDVWRSVAARRVQIDEMTTATSNLSRAMAQHANDTFKEADTTLIGMVERIEEDGTSPEALVRLHRSLATRVAQLPQLNGLFVYDRDGAWVVNSQPALESRFNNSDREYFEYHRTHTDQGTHIGPPVQSRSTGRWIVPVSRRIDAPDGSFAGVALATIDIEFFSRFYDSLDLGQSGAAVLVLNTGVMVVRRPFEDRFVGKNVIHTTLFRAHLEPGRAGIFTTNSSQDHITRLNSVRELQDYPLFVAAALAEDEILGPWWRDTLWHACVTGLLALVLALFGASLVRQVTARTRVEQELARSLATTQTVLDTAISPIITVDERGAIRSFNSAGEKVFGYKANEVIGQNIRILVPPPHLDAYNEYIMQFKWDNRATAECELAGLRKDGTSFPAHVSTGAMYLDGALHFVSVITDISRQKKERSELADARDQLLLAADIAELGIWSWDLATGKLHWNARMFEIYQYPHELLDNGLHIEHWRLRVHPEDRDATFTGLREAVAGRTGDLPPFRIVLPDGTTRRIQSGMRTQRDANGTAVVMTGVNYDITDQYELEFHLRNAKEQADEASAAKSSFLANMSHEIRTPMNAVLGMLHLVQLTTLDGRQHDYVSKAETAAKSLLNLLNDILDYSKIEAGKLQLDSHPFEPEKLMEELAVVLSGNQGEKDVEVLFDLDPSLPAVLIGDGFRLQQVLINLAGNALKFTSTGQIVVSVQRLDTSNDAVRVRICVSDSGIGISEEQLERIFEGFTQAEASTSRRYGGSGLGLVISKRLVAMMGGQLEVQSRMGEGSRFWFDITLGVDASQPRMHDEGAIPGQGARILIADDNAIAGEIMSRTVRSLGWQADVVTNGVAAIERIDAAARGGAPYDVALLDWRMPVLDGLDTARLIGTMTSSQSLLAPPLVLLVTAFGREVLNDSQEAGDAPFAGFLTKPVTPKQLTAAIRAAVPGHGGALPADARPSLRKARRLAGLSLLVVEDNALNRQVAEGVLLAEGAHVTLADGGREGVDMVLAGAARFDAVLMDVQMPDLDGLEATRMIRADGRFAALPIVAMTANASGSDRDACIEAGMNDHVGKPIDVERLVTVLRARTGRMPADAHAQEAGAHDAAASSTTEARDSIVARFGGNLELIRNVVDGFGAQTEKQLTRLAAKLAAQDVKGAASVLHAIKGSAGTVGAAALAKLASALESDLLSGEHDARGLATSSANVPRMQQLLASSVTQLTQEFARRPSIPATRSNETPLDDEDWRVRLSDIVTLLDASNLQAIALSENLSPHAPAGHREDFEQFLARVRALDFARASEIAREMLEQA